jgi:hypothetical protein
LAVVQHNTSVGVFDAIDDDLAELALIWRLRTASDGHIVRSR